MYQPSIFDFYCYFTSNSNSCAMLPMSPIHLPLSTGSVHSPPHQRSDSNGSGISDEDSNSEVEEKISLLRKKSLDLSKLLPPIGVFWDIENCQVPKGKSATAVAQAIRDRFFDGYREADFIVVCDVTKEKTRIIQELNDAQVSLIHVAATCKNAADEKLRQSIRRFADIHSAPAAIILISGDVNFAGDLNDLRHRKKLHVILVHTNQVSEALVLCASEHYRFSDVVENILVRQPVQNTVTCYKVIVSNLPEEKEPVRVKTRLKQLCENTGGRVGIVTKSLCTIRFPSLEFAKRARKRMDGQDVFGNKIIMSDPIPMEDWSCGVRRTKKVHPGKEEAETVASVLRRGKEEAAFHFNDLYAHKAAANCENNRSQVSQNLDPSFHHQLTKNMAPFFSNNITNFTFPKVPNIENLRVAPANSGTKSYLNNFDGGAGSGLTEGDQKKMGSDNRKFNNVSNNQMGDGFNLRLNNSVSNSENGLYSMENSHLYMGQSQQLDLLPPSAFIQRNLAPSAMSDETPSLNHAVNRNNGGGSAAGRLIRGTHGGNGVAFNGSSGRVSSTDDGSESFNSSDLYFEPIQKPVSECSSPVDLHVSGLDPHMDLMVAKNLLTNTFKMHVEVLSVSVFCLSDGSLVASVKVPSFQDAQYAISQLQRRRFGSRRITIAFQNVSRYQRQLVRSQVAQLLSEMPQNKTPLFRFTELFKSRFLSSVSVSELNKMKDVCVISEEESGRMISANSKCQINSFSRHEKKEAAAPYCQLHSHKTLSDSELPVLPTVKISLKLLTNRIRTLLESHAGKLFLPSLGDCYESQFGPLPEDAGGVPLEHLVSCIPGIELSQSPSSFKYLTWSQAVSQSSEEHVKCVSPMLVGTMSIFTRELLDLLKETPKCLLPFSQFIPSYHRKYGRQCRVSDYGYTKLIDLLESLPHILQVIGNGTYKMVTLSHKAQIRRFTTDLLRVLKNQANRQIDLRDFGTQYEKVIGRTWDPCHYGLCELEDLISCAPPSAIVMETKEDGRTLISIPKRVQTPEEVELTKKFAQEVVELLKRVPNCSMEFNKFVPAYHNQFGRQCRVSSYGCFKLIELFESIPDTVIIQEDTSRNEKYLVLTPAKKLQVFAERVCEILSSKGGIMLLFRLEFAYQFYQYESMVAPADCQCETFEEVLLKIPEYVKLEDTRNGRIVILIQSTDPAVLIRRVRFIMLNQERLTVSAFVKAYTQQYKVKIEVDAELSKIPEAVKMVKKGSETFVTLTPLSTFANQMYRLLSDHKGRIPLFNFESAYLNKFKKPCLPAQFGHPNLSSLLAAIPETVTFQSNGYYTNKRVIALNVELQSAGFRLPAIGSGHSKDSDHTDRCEEKTPRSYDLWQSDSLFPAWNDLNGFVPDNITVPHPSELPLPSAKLSSPIQKMIQMDPGYRNEVETTSTMDEPIPVHLDSDKVKVNRTKNNNNNNNALTNNNNNNNNNSGIKLPEENKNKRMSRIAAQFDNLM